VRRRVPPVEFSDGEPPQELLRFGTRASSPSWTAEEFAAWLRARAAWRETHPEPLPGPMARERIALGSLELPQALVEAERAAPTAEPDWTVWAQDRRSSLGRDIGLLPVVVRPANADGDTRQGSTSEASPA
jgi:hypothetical protein